MPTPKKKKTTPNLAETVKALKARNKALEDAIKKMRGK
jgi:hypothetical protein